MNLALKSENFQTSAAGALKPAWVTQASEGYLAVSDGETGWLAQVAASCLLAPQVGDLVLAYVDAEKVYVLSVLERDSARWAEIALPEKTTLKAGPLAIKAASFSVEATVARFKGEELTATGDLLRVDYKVAHFLAGLVSSVCRSFLARVRNFAFRAEESASLASQSLRIAVDEDLRAQAGTMDFKAQDSVKIDGRDVRLG
jgi:hypothetical protein